MRIGFLRGGVISGSASTATGAEALSIGNSKPTGLKQTGKLVGQMSSGYPNVHGGDMRYPTGDLSSLVENASQKHLDTNIRKSGGNGKMSAQGFSIKNRAD